MYPNQCLPETIKMDDNINGKLKMTTLTLKFHI